MTDSSHDHFGQHWAGAGRVGLQIDNTGSGGNAILGTVSCDMTGANNYAGVRGANTNPGKINGFGVLGDTLSQQGAGVGGFAGVNGGDVAGVLGYNMSPHGAGVEGVNVSGTTPGIGVLGKSDAGFAVAGRTVQGTGVYGSNNNSNAVGHAGWFDGRVHVTQGLVVDGPLSAPQLPRAGHYFRDQRTTLTNEAPIDVTSITVTPPAAGRLFVIATCGIQIRYLYGVQLLVSLHGPGNQLLDGRQLHAQEVERLYDSFTLHGVLDVQAGPVTLVLRAMGTLGAPIPNLPPSYVPERAIIAPRFSVLYFPLAL